MTDRFIAAVAAGALAPDELINDLLQPIVEIARVILNAQAATVFLLDDETDELVFEAVSGSGSQLTGSRLPATTGIAGWVLVTRQPLVVEDLNNDPRFARDVASELGYVPNSLMAVPLLRGDRALGVLEVLDRTPGHHSALDEIELLSLFASQAAIALDLQSRAIRARKLFSGQDDVAVVARIAAAVLNEEAEGTEQVGLRFLQELERLLARNRP